MRVRRMFTALLLPLLVVLAAVATASPASAGSVANQPTAVGTGVNRTVTYATWTDERPTRGIGRPFTLHLKTTNGTSCSSSRVNSVWVQRVQAGTGNLLASGYLKHWDRCQTLYDSWGLDPVVSSYDLAVVSGDWSANYNLWSGPGGSPSPTAKQMLRVLLFDSSGTKLGAVELSYPG